MTPSLLSTPMRYFLEVAQAGSVNQAAARLFVAASAVSRQIAKLEGSLGTPLFDRSARGMVLTAAGLRLAGHLRLAALDADQVLQQVLHLGGQAAGRVRLACTEGFAAGFVAGWVLDFQDAQPGCQIELLVGAPDQVAQWLLRGEADIGLKYAMSPDAGLRVEHAAQAPVLAVMTPDHPLAQVRTVALADVVAYPLMVGSVGMTARQLFDLACSARGLRYEPLFVSNFSSVMLPLLRSPQVLLSGRLTVVHWLARGAVVARPFDDAMLGQRRLEVLSLQGRTLPALVATFLQALVEAVEAAAAPPVSPPCA
ncbi:MULTISPECIES: LysR family transcriptional regulator [unclassified Acidovorax]|uniref:LysR family transcriptional regulator n=1 Tax=unclassified Acidovorax TaxID=2684926 RepID=UPI002882F1FC|nr:MULTISPECIES: LysR family transcriptional regulator [unclassified Acidovorax]